MKKGIISEIMGLLNVNKFMYFVLIVFGLINNSYGQNCSINCQPSADAETPTCDPGTEVCLFGCVSGFTGSLCDINCGENCLNCSLTSDNVTVECNTCDVGFYHKDGDCLPCGSTCLANISSSLPVCRQSDGSCEFGCNPTFYGALCNLPCSALCEGKQCHRDTGHCMNGCVAEFLSGDQCKIPCNSGCVGSTCTQNGTCKQGCQVQFWGPACDSMCSSGCHDSTELSNAATRTCNAADGVCLFGCTDGQWGLRCESLCSDNCINNTCNEMYGNCTAGCKSGWYGSHCNRSCSPVCVDNVCDGVTGVCQCEEGVTGTLCLDVQGPGSEDTEEGSSIVALVFIVLGIVITLIFIVFCFYLVRREV